MSSEGPGIAEHTQCREAIAGGACAAKPVLQRRVGDHAGQMAGGTRSPGDRANAGKPHVLWSGRVGVREEVDRSDLRVDQPCGGQCTARDRSLVGVVQPCDRPKPVRHCRCDALQMREQLLAPGVQSLGKRTRPLLRCSLPARATLSENQLRKDRSLKAWINAHAIRPVMRPPPGDAGRSARAPRSRPRHGSTRSAPAKAFRPARAARTPALEQGQADGRSPRR
jgi:hypothetical protein